MLCYVAVAAVSRCCYATQYWQIVITFARVRSYLIPKPSKHSTYITNKQTKKFATHSWIALNLSPMRLSISNKNYKLTHQWHAPNPSLPLVYPLPVPSHPPQSPDTHPAPQTLSPIPTVGHNTTRSELHSRLNSQVQLLNCKQRAKSYRLYT